jgi:hypothetical protein
MKEGIIVFNKPDKMELKIRIGLFLWVFVVNIAAPILVPQYPAWPMWVASIYYFTAGMTLKAAQEAFCGGLVGLIAAYALGAGFEVLAPSLGLLPVLVILLFIILGLIIVGGAYVPIALNNSAFLYLTIATIHLETIGTNFLPYILMLIVGGGILVGGCLAIVQTVVKGEMKKGAANGQQ